MKPFKLVSLGTATILFPLPVSPDVVPVQQFVRGTALGLGQGSVLQSLWRNKTARKQKQTLIPLLHVPGHMRFSSPVFPSLGQDQQTWAGGVKKTTKGCLDGKVTLAGQLVGRTVSGKSHPLTTKPLVKTEDRIVPLWF